MKRLNFDPQGKLILDFKEETEIERNVELKRTDSLEFLKTKKYDSLKGKDFWSLNDSSGEINPLKFSNGKTQEDVIKEILDLVKEGKKIIFLKGACGTGKSAIALNVARVLGRASIIVPVKNLQKQYEKDYMGDKFLVKKDGEKLKIAMLTGRENHDSILFPGISCADPNLPENIKLVEKNYGKLVDYFKDNPFLSGREIPKLKSLRRLSVAPANPYWSPIITAEYDLNQIKDAKKIRYKGVGGREYIFYHRKNGCSYYDQYLAYKSADVIIFNSAKYKAELSIGRKPETDIEIIDEADEFLDSLFEQDEINLTRLATSMVSLTQEESIKDDVSQILDLINLEERNKKALGIDENMIYKMDETKIDKIISCFLKNAELEAEIIMDDSNYANKILEIANVFIDKIEDTYVTYRKEDDNLYVKLVSTNLASKINELKNKNKILLFMSGTLHSEKILKEIFGMEEFEIVEAETLARGSIEIIKTGKEFDCKYQNFQTNKKTKEDYYEALSHSIEKSISPKLVHVHSFQDLPSDEEKSYLRIFNLPSREELIQIQRNDKNGDEILKFKKGDSGSLFTTKCSRGVDFPGEMCNSIIFTKYPNPNISDTFWQILKKTHPNNFWDFYKDKAYREFLQRIYRALRSKDDMVYILSPDSRVLNAVSELQKGIVRKS